MIRLLIILLTGICCSLYMFPFAFAFFPIGNTKIYLAICGFILLVFKKICYGQPTFSQSALKVALAAFLVSLICVGSLVYNGTRDYVYAMYIIQMWVWSAAAYFVVQCMETTHGRVELRIIILYIVGVCAVQCLFALMNEFIPDFRKYVDTYILQGQPMLNQIKRIYGIGASLDTAGSRFACALILLSYNLMKNANENGREESIIWQVFLFVFIIVVGSIVSRTTLVGGSIGILYMLVCMKNGINVYGRKIVSSFFVVLALVVPVLSALYLFSPEVNRMLSFAFEPFFNFVEKGKLETDSSSTLLQMWGQIPQNMKTWIIGDGYFLSPYLSDPYYIGIHKWAYYQGTDVGYLRFVFYFGLVGLFVFACFFVCCMRECEKKFPNDKVVFRLLFLMNCLLWIKVATDIFLIYAFFLMADSLTEEQRVISINEWRKK